MKITSLNESPKPPNIIKNLCLPALLSNPIVFLSTLGFLGSCAVFVPVKVYAVAPIAISRPKTAQIGAIDLFSGNPTLRRIAACESTGDANGTPRQFIENGSVLWGTDPRTDKVIKRDEGELQINTWIWGPTAAKMNLDLATENGNVAFGKYLYEKYGTSPWTASEGCWSSRT
jgi:hypothetical protein